MWYRVFGGSDVQPEPAALLERLNGMDAGATGRFGGDEGGWFWGELVVAEVTLRLERFLASEEGIRAELNAWAAWLETCADNPHHVRLMERMIQTRQLFTLERPDDPPEAARVDRLCVQVCRCLAGVTEGVYQVDRQGMFAADGTLLVSE